MNLYVMRLFIIFSILVFSVACTQDQVSNNNPQVISPPGSDIVVPSGTYRYVGFDSNNILVVGGWIRFNPAQRIFRGKWQLESVEGEEILGPQNGIGILEGTSEEKGSSYRVRINLNRGRADDNVYLDGNVHENEFIGTWSYGTLSGLANRGHFYAIKLP